MKKITLLLTGAFLLCPINPAKAFDQKDKALIIGAVTTLIGGELIIQAIQNSKTVIDFCKHRPHVAIAGLAVSIIAARQYKDAVINPLVEWYNKK